MRLVWFAAVRLVQRSGCLDDHDVADGDCFRRYRCMTVASDWRLRGISRDKLGQLFTQIGDQLLHQVIPNLHLRAQVVRCHATRDRDIEREHQERLAELQAGV